MKKIIVLTFLLLFASAKTFAQDKIEKVTAPQELKAGEDVSVSVAYTVSEKRNIRVFVQLNEDPWTTVASEAKGVKTGSGTADYTLKIPSDVSPGSNYKVVVSLAPLRKGWPDRLDDWTQGDVVISE
jgi:uncharacterized GH25 family protein